MLRVSRILHVYAGREVQVGERFEVEQPHIFLPVLLANGIIEPEEGEPGYATRAAELKQTEQPQGSSGRTRRARSANLAS